MWLNANIDAQPQSSYFEFSKTDLRGLASILGLNTNFSISFILSIKIAQTY